MKMTQAIADSLFAKYPEIDEITYSLSYGDWITRDKSGVWVEMGKDDMDALGALSIPVSGDKTKYYRSEALSSPQKIAPKGLTKTKKSESRMKNLKSIANEMKNSTIKTSKALVKAKVGNKIKKAIKDLVLSKSNFFIKGKAKFILESEITWVLITMLLAFAGRLYVGRFSEKIILIAECLEAANADTGVNAAEEALDNIIGLVDPAGLLDAFKADEEAEDLKNEIKNAE